MCKSQLARMYGVHFIKALTDILLALLQNNIFFKLVRVILINDFLLELLLILSVSFLHSFGVAFNRVVTRRLLSLNIYNLHSFLLLILISDGLQPTLSLVSLPTLLVEEAGSQTTEPISNFIRAHTLVVVLLLFVFPLLKSLFYHFLQIVIVSIIDFDLLFYLILPTLL